MCGTSEIVHPREPPEYRYFPKDSDFSPENSRNSGSNLTGPASALLGGKTGNEKKKKKIRVKGLYSYIQIMSVRCFLFLKIVKNLILHRLDSNVQYLIDIFI